MSAAETDHAHEGHGQGHEHHHHHGHDDHAAHGSLRGYVTGFLLAAILTAIPFWIVMGDVFRSPVTAAVVVMAFAIAQILVHMVYFLHMSPKSEGGWTMLAMIFTVVLVVITLAGSFWVMFHLHANMTPGIHDMDGTPLIEPEKGAR